MKYLLVSLTLLFAIPNTCVSGLKCNEGVNVSLGGIPLYHWAERNCTGSSNCFGQDLTAKISDLGDVRLSYGACITSSYSKLLNCEDMFDPESTMNPSQVLDLIPDLENRFNDLILDFVNGGINEFITLLSNGKNIDEFLSGFVKFMEHVGFNMEKFKPLQPSLGKFIVSLFNTSDWVTMNTTGYNFLHELGKVDTYNPHLSQPIYNFIRNFLRQDTDLDLIKSNIVAKTSIEILPGLVESMLPKNSNKSLWYNVAFDLLGKINFTQPKKSVKDCLAIIRSTYNIPNDVSRILNPILNSLPDLVDQSVKGNSTYFSTWYLDVFKMYSERNNATEALDKAFTAFLESAILVNWTVPLDLQTTIEWLPGLFYKFFPANKSAIENVYFKIAKRLPFDVKNPNHIAAPTKLSDFIFNITGKIIGSFPVPSQESTYIINFSAMFYDLLSDYTAQLDRFFQILSDGFQNYPNFNSGNIITNLTIAMGGEVPQEMKPLLRNLQFVIKETLYVFPFNISRMLNSFDVTIKDYKQSYPDSKFPVIFQRLLDAMLDFPPTFNRPPRVNDTKFFFLEWTYFAIDLEFALFKVITNTSHLQLVSSNSPEYGFYYRLMSTIDPDDVKNLAKDITEWLFTYRVPNVTNFFSMTRSSINSITSKFSKTVLQDLRRIFSPDICRFGVCNSDLCNTHAYIAEQQAFIKPTTTTQPATTTPIHVPKGLPQCMRKTLQSPTSGKHVFPTTEGNTLSRSVATCANSSSTATVKCVVDISSSSASFDVDSLEEYSCNIDPGSLLASTEKTGLTSSGLESTMGQLSALSSKRSSEDVKATIDVLTNLKDAAEEENVNVTEEAIVSLLWVMDDIHSIVKHEKTKHETTLSRNDKVSLLEILEVYGSNLVLTDDVFTKTSDTSLLQAQKLNCSSNTPIVFEGTMPVNESERSAKSSIPKSALPDCNGKNNAVFYLHRDSTLFPKPRKVEAKINQVLSSQISRTKLQNLEEPVKQSFGLPPRDSGSKRSFITQKCSFMNLTTGQWEYKGCKTVIVDAHNTSCICDHMTNFAVLVQTYDVESSYAIEIVGYIGCSCSTIALILVLIIYLGFEKLRSNQVNQMLIHLCFCLLVGYLTFLIGVQRPRAYTPCMVVGAILQFSFLSAWGWMFAECMTMYKKFVRVFSNMSSTYVIKSAVIVYTISFIITLTTALIAYGTGDVVEYSGWELAVDNDPLFHPSYYVSDRLCWLHGYSLYFGFLTPVAIAFVVNIYGFIRIIHVLTKPSEIRSTKEDNKDMKEHALRILTVSVLLGVTWVFAIPMTITDDVITNEIFSWLFSIANAFQGVVIFLLFCVRRKDVRKMWMNVFPCCRSSSKYSNTLNNVSVSASTTTGTLQRTKVTSLSDDSNSVGDTKQSTVNV